MNEQALRFGPDTTVRLPCRSGDMLIWFRWIDPLRGAKLDIIDLWAFRDGDQAIISNRVPDLPTWFRLHPMEVCSASLSLLKDFMQRNPAPAEPMDGPSIWRPFCGDLLAWTGEARPGQRDEEGVLQLFQLTTECLVLGEAKEYSPLEPPFAIEPNDNGKLERAHHAANMARRTGMPREMTAGNRWQLRL